MNILATAYLNRSFALSDLGRFSAAIDDATRAIELEPDGVNILAAAYVIRSAAWGDRYEEALSDDDAAIALQPNVGILAEAHFNRSIHLSGLGREDEAKATLATACELGLMEACESSTPGPSAAGKIAFMSTRDGNSEVYVMNANGSGPTNLTNNPAYDNSPAWSPDGSRIAFSSNRDDNEEIYVMNADGTGVIRLTNNPAYDFTAAWSPDGSRVVFSSNRDGNFEIYIMNADGSGLTRLTNDPALDGEPAWSPAP